LLVKNGYDVFDTNSVPTGDYDANQVSFDVVIERYGKGSSFMYFLEDSLRKYVESSGRVVFIDSFKAYKDYEVVSEMFPESDVAIWYVHASYKLRLSRYKVRDLDAGLRSQKLSEHDDSLYKYGMPALIKNASYVVNMDDDKDKILQDVFRQIRKFNKSDNGMS
jgi:dephospho-CoA kinase